MLYLLLLVGIIFIPLTICILLGFFFEKCLNKEGYYNEWAKGALFVLGTRYTLKWLTKLFFRGR